MATIEASIPPNFGDYRIAWLCRLAKEEAAVFFDSEEIVFELGGTLYSCGRI